MTSIPRLHLISSRQHCPVERFPEVAAAAAAEGVDAVHIREPGLDDESLRELARSTRDALRRTGCRVLLNGKHPVAFDLADGAHLPEEGADPRGVRSRLPDDALVGVSVHSVSTAVRAERDSADYLFAGHIFETGSKPGQAGRGLAFLEEVLESVTIPVIAIGGIAPENTPDVMRAGAHGVAVLSGILAAEDPGDAASRFAAAMDCCGGEEK